VDAAPHLLAPFHRCGRSGSPRRETWPTIVSRLPAAQQLHFATTCGAFLLTQEMLKRGSSPARFLSISAHVDRSSVTAVRWTSFRAAPALVKDGTVKTSRGCQPSAGSEVELNLRRLREPRF
jgi:hypothetical protein